MFYQVTAEQPRKCSTFSLTKLFESKDEASDYYDELRKEGIECTLTENDGSLPWIQ